MPFWRKRPPSGPLSLDEFVGKGEDRSASPLDLDPKTSRWPERLAKLSNETAQTSRAELAIPAFSLVRGGDLFERTGPRRTSSPQLIETYADRQLSLEAPKIAAEEREAALTGVLRVLTGNPALLKRMLLARPIRIVIVPKGHDFRQHGFPRHTNPHAAGIFWNATSDPQALLGLREERILEKPWLMIHEMTHAVHLLGLTKRERDDLDKMLRPVYGSARWVEEALAIYAECAFGATYDDDDLRAPHWYGKIRRDWNPQHVFSLFVRELFRPQCPP